MTIEIFVFGSNLAGRHGKGAALEARKKHGAVYGVGIGLTGNSYAIPTKGYNLEVLSLDVIAEHIGKFKEFARINTEYSFRVTRIGCGLAGAGKYYSSKGKTATKSYTVWNSMIERCYSGRYPSYEGVEVCKEWLNYQNFAEWYNLNSFDKHGKYQLDKDLLGDSKLYSPDTCCLLKDNINQLITSEGFGYVLRDGSWLVNSLSGYVTVSSEAIAKDVVASYRINKLYEIIRCVERQTFLDTRIVPALWLRVLRLQEYQSDLRKLM